MYTPGQAMTSQLYLDPTFRVLHLTQYYNYNDIILRNLKGFSFFDITALLRYNSNTIKFTFLKYKIQWSLVYAYSCSLYSLY